LVPAVVAVVVALEETGPAAERPRTEMATRLDAALLIRLAPSDGLGAVTGAWGDVWAYDYARGMLLRLDGRSGRVIARIPLGPRAGLAADGQGLWALRWGGRFWRTRNRPLLRIDPVSNRIEARSALRAQQQVDLAAEPAARRQHEPLGALRELVGQLHRDAAAERVPDDVTRSWPSAVAMSRAPLACAPSE
jgi:hypothetical protein